MTLTTETKRENRLRALREISGSCTLREAYQIAKGTTLLDLPIVELLPVAAKPKPSKAWETWPSDLLEEISAVLSENDSGFRSITLEDYLGRVKSVWSLEIPPSTFRGYMKVLGRKGWTK